MLFTLFLAVNLNVLPSFFYSFTFGALLDIFITLVYSEVVYFTVSSLWKQSFLPHKGLAPLAAGLKDQRRSSDPSGGARTEACLVVPCCWLERSPMFFGLLYVCRSSRFVLHHVSLLRVFMFSCFQLCEKGEFSPHKLFETLTVWLKIELSTNWASGARAEACHIVSCWFFFKLTFSFFFTTLVVLRLTVVFSLSH